MNKPTFYISAPFDTYSGYGARSRDVIKSIIKSDKYEVKLLSQRWGNTPWEFINNHKKEWGFLLDYLHNQEDQKHNLTFGCKLQSQMNSNQLVNTTLV